MNTKYLTKASLIAGIYLVLVLIQIPMGNLAFGPIQLRIAEGLTLLPVVELAAIPGLFVGCLISNLILASYSAFGLVDILGGSLITLLAAYLTSKTSNKFIAALPPILLNGFIVSIWVSYFTSIPYWLTVLGIIIGEAISVIVFGSIILSVYKKAKIYLKNK
ncbi:QueT transporter family protein [Schnuerera sp. xch1]|uniref:QueT transporter family protein n=1 Tax=Schnuerera sp. xch1 TaxID=2874283 RepID=UPI001CBA986A|nr:QueT transporter family protein [Schnuerera sp. xch1]MBZ2173718.1 QueT transporter family protein [Schnuerera sp. xch1]